MTKTKIINHLRNKIRIDFQEGVIKKPRLLIVGHGRHGKDSVAELFNKNYGLTFSSSSEAAARIFIYDELKGFYGYESFEDCYTDRHNRRAEWFDLITEFNKDDKARLAKLIMADNDIYVGMRSYEEIITCQSIGLFDTVLWVKRNSFPLEDSSSFDIDITSADIVIENNGSLKRLEEEVDKFMFAWYYGSLLVRPTMR
jgi:hypothetical protein